MHQILWLLYIAIIWYKFRTQTLQLKNKGNAKLNSKTTGHVQCYAKFLNLSSKGEQTKRASVHKTNLQAHVRACDSKKNVTAHSMPAKFNYTKRLQFQKRLTPIISNMSLFGNNQKFAFNRDKCEVMRNKQCFQKSTMLRF